jgi:ATP-dependent DNA helicase DinG
MGRNSMTNQQGRAMALQAAVSRAFEQQGGVSDAVEEFKPRAGQITMALAVAATMEEGGVLVVEAGTGVGKTFAYLVPALLSGERVLISTATKALQDQLFGRDIPRLLAALGLPARVAVLKGRGSYLCLQRLGTARQGTQVLEPSAIRELARIEEWSNWTRAGDLAELTGLDESSVVIPMVSSSRENCLGARCPKIQNCHVNLARREAMAADMVVVNHHLFFADLNVRESGVAELLPTVGAVVFDECHQLNEIGVQFLGAQLSTGQLMGFCRDLGVQGPLWARGLANWGLLVLDLERAITAFRHLCGQKADGVRRRWDGLCPQGIPEGGWSVAMVEIHRVLAESHASLRLVSEVSPDLEILSERVQNLLVRLQGFLQPVVPGSVRWLETGNQIRMLVSPLDIADAMRNRVIGHAGSPTSRKSWVFTSATLGGDPTMGLFVDSCGLAGARVLRVDSPFDYVTQAALYVPSQMPVPSDPSHSAHVAMLAAEGAEILGGRTLILTTTLRAMRQIGEKLRSHFSHDSPIEILVQGQSPKRELVERFRRLGAGGAGACVLVASTSFWEGVDIPGDALQLLVIDKLPFAPPNDPLVEARAQQAEANGKNAFRHFHLPQAVIALKQGVGRLIRRETDRGVLVVCDVRLNQMGYGQKMLAALPPMKVLSSPDQFRQELFSITTPSTKGPFLSLLP